MDTTATTAMGSAEALRRLAAVRDSEAWAALVYTQGTKSCKVQLILTQKACGTAGSSPALADGKLIVRDGECLYCFELKPSPKNGK